MTERAFATLADVTTLRVGGPARDQVLATTTDALASAVTACDRDGEPVLLLGGGSNVVVADAGFAGTVVLVATRGTEVRVEADSVVLTVAAGEPWDALVRRSVEEGWSGIEALSGIPGSTGATPLQNVGAYGQEIADVIGSVRALDRATGAVRELTRDECGFRYRSSRFKDDPDRWLVLTVTLRLHRSQLGEVRYEQLARHMGVRVGATAPIADIRREVLALRSAKGMVLDPADHDTWSVGSFFTNPVMTPGEADVLPVDCPRYASAEGTKVSAAWLIEAAGVGRGFALPGSRAAVSSKHTLALTNRGGASAAEVLALAAEIQDRVREAFGIDLEPEPRIVRSPR